MDINLSSPIRTTLRHGLALVVVLLAITLWSCNDDEAIDPRAPQACFTVPDGDLYVDATVTFDASCSKGAATYAWEFSDGRKYSSAEVRRTFSDAGDFTVALTITDSLGHSSSEEKNVKILPSPFVIHEGLISTDEVWEEGLHLVRNDVFIEGGSVQIMPGAVVYVNKERSIFIGDTFSSPGTEGSLTAIGTAEKPITFLPASGVDAPGEWGHIYFSSNTAAGSALKYCIIKFGGKGGNYHFTESDYLSHGVVDVVDATVALDHTTITGGANYGVNVIGEGKFSSFSNNTITGNSASPVRIQVNAIHTLGENNTIEGDGILLKDATFLTAEATWLKQDVPYVIDGYFEVGSNTSSGTYHLTLEPGAEVDFTKGSLMSVATNGTLTAVGTSGSPIVFSSHEAVKAKGDWRNVTVSGKAVLDYCQFEYGGNDDLNYQPYMVALGGAGSTVNNSTFIHSATDGLYAVGSGLAGSSQNTFRDCDRYGLTVEATLAHQVDQTHTFDCMRNIHIRASANNLNETVTWSKRPFPYYFSGELAIRDNAVGPGGLTIEAGTEIRFLPEAKIVVDGKFIADGTAEPIIFTIDESSITAPENYWSGIFFTSNTPADSKLVGCKISYGGNNPGYPSYGMITCSSINAPLIENNEITNSASHGISIGVDASPVLSGNTFSGNAGSDVFQQ